MAYEIFSGDNIEILPTLTHKYSLIVIDPPFNTGKKQVRKIIEVEENAAGDRIGFGEKRYSTVTSSDSASYQDKFESYEDFLMPRVKLAIDLLTDNGSIMIHLDQNESHYIKVAMDKLMGRDHYIQDIIWSYDYGAKSKKYYPKKFDTILWYVKNPKDYIFNYDLIDRIPYLAPDLVGPEKAAKGKVITSCWQMTIEPTNSNNRKQYNYPTMKPTRLLERIVKMHSRPGDWTLDFFAGSGVMGAVSLDMGRNTTAIDQNPASIEIIKRRFAKYSKDEIFTSSFIPKDGEKLTTAEPPAPTNPLDAELQSFIATPVKPIKPKPIPVLNIDKTMHSAVLPSYRKENMPAVEKVNALNFNIYSVTIHDKKYVLKEPIRVTDCFDHIVVHGWHSFKIDGKLAMEERINIFFTNTYDGFEAGNNIVNGVKKSEFFAAIGL